MRDIVPGCDGLGERPSNGVGEGNTQWWEGSGAIEGQQSGFRPGRGNPGRVRQACRTLRLKPSIG
jgi:hypothetical protein